MAATLHSGRSNRTAGPAPAAAISGLVLRPAPGLKPLADRVARVLSLRFGGGGVDVGGPPPPGLLEAVPAGHVALAAEGGRIRLVLGAAFGTYFEASVPYTPPAREPDVRSLALAVEALRDRAMEARERSALVDPGQPEDAESRLVRASRVVSAPALGESLTSAPPVDSSEAMAPPAAGSGGWGLRDDDAELPLPPRDGAPQQVEPIVYVRAYGGASVDSGALQVGVATGGGLCVLGNCLLLGFESPLPFGPEARAIDVRYRYFTVLASFYSRPWQFGRFAPAASLGFISRIGHFRRDMGMAGSARAGLETDLGLRGTLEGSLHLFAAVELTAELGLDYALDRWRLDSAGQVAYRGERAAFWAQGGIRVRAL